MESIPTELAVSLPTTLFRAEQILLDANTCLLDLSDEIRRGPRAGMDAGIVRQILTISLELLKVADLLRASDEVPAAFHALH